MNEWPPLDAWSVDVCSLSEVLASSVFFSSSAFLAATASSLHFCAFSLSLLSFDELMPLSFAALYAASICASVTSSAGTGLMVISFLTLTLPSLVDADLRGRALGVVDGSVRRDG